MSSVTLPNTLRLGIDFGTTNSVIVLATPDGETKTIRFSFPDHPDSDTCRTLLCLWQDHEGGRLVLKEAIGPAAIDAYLDDPAESRLIMSMKTYLAQKSFRETQLLGRRMTLDMLIAQFLKCLLDNVDLDPAQVSTTVGRPVHFAGDRADDAFGEQRLRESFARAGFGKVSIALEPEAAGWRFAQRLKAPATVLVGDFGGGTSDFSILRLDPDSKKGAEALGYSGVGIAGDQFDYRIIDNVISPHLGKNCTYRVMGGSPLPVPIEWYASLGRWHRLSLMRTPQTMRNIQDVARTVSEPDKLQALLTIIEDQQGQELYKSVGEAKRALSSAESTVLRFAHENIRIEEEVTRADFERWIAPDVARFEQAVEEALSQAGLSADGIDHVFLTGGTSFVPAVRDMFIRKFGAERVDMGGEFVSVAEGLALMEG